MARRSSARLRAKVSATPQPQKVSNLEYNETLRTPKTAPKLTAVAESDEMPGAFPRSASPANNIPTSSANNTPSRLAEHIAQAITGEHKTPKHATPIKPSMEEMHPQKFHMSTAKPLDEARWLGITSMGPHNEPPKATNPIAAAQGTPTRANTTTTRVVFSPPQASAFTFSRPSLGLSPEARKLMDEKKDEAAKIKEKMLLGHDDGNMPDWLSPQQMQARKMATPKGKMGRFSDVHKTTFNKMDSIANHPSAFRADSKTPKKPTTALPTAAPQSLKRTKSKADLNQSASALPRATSKRDLVQPESSTQHTAKRVKRSAEDDVATARPQSSSSNAPSTPTGSTPLKIHPSNPHLHRGLATPTASSLARAASIKSTKRSMIPSLNQSPSKSSLIQSPSKSSLIQSPSKSSLIQSPSKSSLKNVTHQVPGPATPLLARSPSKMHLSGTTPAPKIEEPASPLLSRSAIRPVAAKQPESSESAHLDPQDTTPFLSRSPSKMSVAADKSEIGLKPDKTPLLARSPSKIAIPEAFSHPSHTPVKSAGTSLMNRFNLLRQSPMKSILRTPQRLYSNDPMKIASGTHFATPEKALDRPSFTAAAPPKTAPVQKHVDFSASTKGLSANKERASKPDTPTKAVAEIREPITALQMETQSVPSPTPIAYPTLPAHTSEKKIKSHRRMTMALPSDFTFRAGSEITFAPSPNRKSDAPTTLAGSIRHVSAEPTTPVVRKRKFEGLDEGADANAVAKREAGSDKENADEEADEQRPAKKARPNGPEPAKAEVKNEVKTPARKYSTLGVKPKGTSTAKPKEKKPGFLSQARLNALAAPKRR